MRALRRPPEPAGSVLRPPEPAGSVLRPPEPAGSVLRPPEPAGSVIIGVGNPHRRDDGFGPAVAQVLLADEELRAAGVRVVSSDGEPARLIDLWRGADLVVLVDIVRGPGPAGRWYELGPDEVARWPATSSHGMSLVETVELARALDRLPVEFVVLAAVGVDFRHGMGLTPALADVVPAVATHAAKLCEGANYVRQ